MTINRTTLLTVLLLATLSSSALAQTYSIDWFTIDGGGGASTGGVYSVSGTIGQPDAGVLIGGSFRLDGGFWGIITMVQSPGSPLLRIQSTTTNSVIIAWPAPSTGFLLQQNSSLSAIGWLSVTDTAVTVGSEKQVMIASPRGNKFYRLVRP
jgi:hypothetical protein